MKRKRAKRDATLAMRQAADREQAAIDQAWFHEYQELGGEKPIHEFLWDVKMMIDHLSLSYISGLAPREPAWANWVEYMQSENAARMVFTAVDSVTPFT